MLLPLAVPVAVCEAVEDVAHGVEVADQVAERRLARRSQGRRRPDRGPAPGVGGDRDRRQRRDRRRRLPRRPALAGHLDRRRRHGRRDARDAVSDALGRWVDAPAEEVLAEFRRRDALLGREIAWEGAGTAPASARWPASTSAATWWSSRRTASPSRWAPAKSPCASRADSEPSHRRTSGAVLGSAACSEVGRRGSRSSASARPATWRAASRSGSSSRLRPGSRLRRTRARS